MGEFQNFLSERLIALLAKDIHIANFRCRPLAALVAPVEREVEVPLVGLEDVETLVVEHGHELQA